MLKQNLTANSNLTGVVVVNPSQRNCYVVNKTCYTNFVIQSTLGPKKSGLVSGNRPGENFFIPHPPAWLNVYQNMYFQFKKAKKQTNKKTRRQKAKETKEEKKNICRKTKGIR